MKLRNATAADIAALGVSNELGMRAFVAEHEGRVLGIAGIAVMRDHAQAFSFITDEMRSHKVAMGRAAIRLRGMIQKMVRECGAPMIALCSPNEPTAPRLLAHIGFVPDESGVYRWAN